MLGMVMGVTSVIAIVSVVEGMQADLEHFFDSMGPNTFTVTRFGFNLTWADYVERAKRKKLTRGLIPVLEESCPDCEEVGAESYEGDYVKYGSLKDYTEIRGETPNVLAMRDCDVLLGRNISWEDDKRRRKVAFLGYKIYENMFPHENPLGQKIKIGDQEFTVIGVAEERDRTMARGWDDNVVIPLSTHQKMYRQDGDPVNLIIMARSLEVRGRAIEEVRSTLRSVRQLPFGDDDDFTILTPDAILGFINDLTRAYRVIMVALPLLSIVIGGIVIMNIMMISVTERTREIGIRKSLGARRRHILIQFLYESLILSFVGGILGIFAGVRVGALMLSSLMDIYVTPTTMAIILGFGIAVAVGLFFGMYPARKASKLDPIKALTYE
jgi:putative ABC transport system permease protein